MINDQFAKGIWINYVSFLIESYNQSICCRPPIFNFCQQNELRKRIYHTQFFFLLSVSFVHMNLQTQCLIFMSFLSLSSRAAVCQAKWNNQDLEGFDDRSPQDFVQNVFSSMESQYLWNQTLKIITWLVPASWSKFIFSWRLHVANLQKETGVKNYFFYI